MLLAGLGVTGGVQRESGAPWERLQTTEATELYTTCPESPTNSRTRSTPHSFLAKKVESHPYDFQFELNIEICTLRSIVMMSKPPHLVSVASLPDAYQAIVAGNQRAPMHDTGRPAPIFRSQYQHGRFCTPLHPGKRKMKCRETLQLYQTTSSKLCTAFFLVFR